MTGSSILEGNSFRAGEGASLGEREAELVEERTRLLGPAYRLFYARPLHVVRGEGAYLYEADGTEYLDAYNNVPGVGHGNARVAEAIGRQAATLNTHTRYLQDGLTSYADELLGTMPGLDQVMFTNSGSESNDLAIRVAREATGGTGVIVTAEAYHGTSYLTAGASPAMGAGFELLPEVRVIPIPDTYRLGDDAADAASLGAWMAARYREAVDSLAQAGLRPAALLLDSIMSSDGVFPDPAGFLAPVLDAVHGSGAMWIADEVQPGLGRTGDTMWGFQRHGIVPDLVTSGKAMGNGVPVSAMAARSEVLAPFAQRVPYFNTFGGNPVSIAAAQAVLDEIRERELMASAASVGAALREGVRAIAASHPRLADVRGAGLYMGIEVVADPATREPDSGAALALVNELRERRVLVSSAGPFNNVIKVRPPLVFGMREVERFLAELEGAAAELGL